MNQQILTVVVNVNVIHDQVRPPKAKTKKGLSKMIEVICWICKQELEEPGALYFGHPYKIEGLIQDHVEKYHICQKCDIWIRTVVKIRHKEENQFTND